MIVIFKPRSSRAQQEENMEWIGNLKPDGHKSQLLAARPSGSDMVIGSGRGLELAEMNVGIRELIT